MNWAGRNSKAWHKQAGDLSNVRRKDVQLLSLCCPLPPSQSRLSTPRTANQPMAVTGLEQDNILCQETVAKVFWKSRARGTSLPSARVRANQIMRAGKSDLGEKKRNPWEPVVCETS